MVDDLILIEPSGNTVSSITITRNSIGLEAIIQNITKRTSGGSTNSRVSPHQTSPTSLKTFPTHMCNSMWSQRELHSPHDQNGQRENIRIVAILQAARQHIPRKSVYEIFNDVQGREKFLNNLG